MNARDDRVIDVLLAHGQSLFRDAVRSVIETQPDFRVVAIAGDGMRAVAEAARTSPDVAMLDSDLPNSDGVRATRSILEQVPGCAVLIVGEDGDTTTLLSAVEAGARGYLTKDAAVSGLIEAARSLHRGESLIPPRMLGGLITGLLERRREHEEAALAASQLTRRERQVIRMAAEGADNDEIARVLVISPQTVRTHIQHVLGKLGAHSRLEAVALLRRSGIGEELEGANR